MANYPQFKNIRIFHCDGYSPGTVLEKVLTFINDPAHKKYRWIDSKVNYFYPSTLAIPHHDSPYKYVWVEVTIIYTE